MTLLRPSTLNRRNFLRRAGAACLLGLFGSRRIHAGRLQWEDQPGSDRASQRRYRADAQVLLLSVPVYRRYNVGGGSVTWSEDMGLRLLEFTGYSLPQRAAGLNRMGFVREMSRLAGDSSETIYFGVMTASPEESADEARAALHRRSEVQLFSAIEGRVSPGHVETATARFTAPAALPVERPAELVEIARHALSDASPKPPDFDVATTRERTFLTALAELLESSQSTGTRFIYNGHRYCLSLRRSRDPKAAAYFHERKLIPPEASVVRAAGNLRRESGGPETDFQLWYEEGAQRPMPLRIEYQAKSFLRLTFEME